MGFFKRLAKAVVRAVKAVVRVAVRIVATAVGVALGVLDLFAGFLLWPQKKLRVQIFILADQNGPVVTEAALKPAIDFARVTFKDRLNVKLLPYGKNMIEIIKEPAPTSALNVGCGWSGLGQEFGQAGEYFNSHLAGWNAAPVALTFPVTVFVVSDVAGKSGCSMGPLTDYVTLDPNGVANPSTMAHEIGHACNLWHSGTQSNLMYKHSNRGDKVKWFQKNLFRSSRHVVYW
jgi:hypothetical protein